MIIINIYAPKTRVPKYTKQTLTNLKGKTDKCRKTARKFNKYTTFNNG